MTQLNFDARQVAPDTGTGDPLPAGWYNVMIDQSEQKPTSDGQGAYLEARYNVLDGAHAGRKLFSRFNIRNNSAKAQEIAWAQLSAVCHATGVLLVQDSQQLHGIPLKIKVSLRGARTDEATGKSYEASNDVKAWKNINEPTETAAVPGAPGGVPAGFGAPGGAPAGFGPPAGAPVAPQGWQQPVAAPAQPWQPQQPPAAPPAAMQPPQQPQQPWVQPGAPVAPPAGPPPGYVAQPPAAAQPWVQPGAPVAPPAGAPAVAQPWVQPGQPAATPPWQQPR